MSAVATATTAGAYILKSDYYYDELMIPEALQALKIQNQTGSDGWKWNLTATVISKQKTLHAA